MAEQEEGSPQVEQKPKTPPEIVAGLRDNLGGLLTAYIAGSKDTETVRKWAFGEDPVPNPALKRLKPAFEWTSILLGKIPNDEIQALMQGTMLLQDKEQISPARLFREITPSKNPLVILKQKDRVRQAMNYAREYALENSTPHSS